MKYLVLTLLLTMLSIKVAESKSKTTYDIKWKESHGKIISKSVCLNYKKGTVAYRACRSQAKDYFREQCKYYKEIGLCRICQCA
jgi:hypothetical protein